MTGQTAPRQHWIDKAVDTARDADKMARHAETAAHSDDQSDKVPGFTAVGALYADVARTYAAIAQACPQTPAEDTVEGIDG